MTKLRLILIPFCSRSHALKPLGYVICSLPSLPLEHPSIQGFYDSTMMIPLPTKEKKVLRSTEIKMTEVKQSNKQTGVYYIIHCSNTYFTVRRKR